MISPVTDDFAKSNDSTTWSSFDKALDYLIQKRMDGLAFVLTKDIVFIDLDHVLENGKIVKEIVNNILNKLPHTFAEKSLSGTGLHILAYGKLPENAKYRNDDLGIEMYDNRRFVCMTGDIWENRKEILDYGDEVIKINHEYCGIKEKRTSKMATNLSNESDYEILRLISQSKQSLRFFTLYNGNISGYKSHSNADYAFVNMLTFWTQDDRQIDSIFRSSALFRDKWDRKLGDSTYGEVTIQNALANTKKVRKQLQI